MEEKQHIGQLFDRIAGTYDGLNHGLSLNIDKRWRRKTVQQMPSVNHVLDVAIGTADLTIEMLRRGKAQQITGLDLSKQMMAIGKQKVEKLAITNHQSPMSNSSLETRSTCRLTMPLLMLLPVRTDVVIFRTWTKGCRRCSECSNPAGR